MDENKLPPVIPGWYDFSPRPPAVDTEVVRSFVSPTNGASFNPGSQITLEIPMGSGGQMIDPSQTCLSFRLTNSSGQTVTLDKSAACVIQQLDVFHGPRLLSSISEYHVLQQLLHDFSTGCDDYKTSGTVRGVADYLPTAIAAASDFATAYYSRVGASITNGSSLTVAIPLVSCIGSLAMRALPTFFAGDNIRVVIKLANLADYGRWTTAPTAGQTISIDNVRLWMSFIRVSPTVATQMAADLGGLLTVPTIDYTQTSASLAAGTKFLSMPIAVRGRSMTAIFVTIRNSSVLESTTAFNLDRSIGGSSVPDCSYRFRIGSTIIPSSFVTFGAEARVELMRALGENLASSSARTSVSRAAYDSDAFCIGVCLQSFPMTDALGDGVRVESTIIFEANFGMTQANALRIDAYCQMEKILEFRSGEIVAKS